MAMLMLLPNCYTQFDIMSITKEVVVTVYPVLVNNYVLLPGTGTADRKQTKITYAKRFEESRLNCIRYKTHTGVVTISVIVTQQET